MHKIKLLCFLDVPRLGLNFYKNYRHYLEKLNICYLIIIKVNLNKQMKNYSTTK